MSPGWALPADLYHPGAEEPGHVHVPALGAPQDWVTLPPDEPGPRPTHGTPEQVHPQQVAGGYD